MEGEVRRVALDVGLGVDLGEDDVGAVVFYGAGGWWRAVGGALGFGGLGMSARWATVGANGFGKFIQVLAI